MGQGRDTYRQVICNRDINNSQGNLTNLTITIPDNRIINNNIFIVYMVQLYIIV